MGLCVGGRKNPRTMCRWGKGCGEEIFWFICEGGGGFQGSCIAGLEYGGNLGAHILGGGGWW